MKNLIFAKRLPYISEMPHVTSRNLPYIGEIQPALLSTRPTDPENAHDDTFQTILRAGSFSDLFP